MLTEREKEVIECMYRTWTENGMGLYGNLCFQDVFDLMEKLGVDKAPGVEKLEEIERRYDAILRESETGI